MNAESLKELLLINEKGSWLQPFRPYNQEALWAARPLNTPVT